MATKNKQNCRVSLLITAFNEPNISKAIESALNQDTKYNYEVILSAPDKETLDIAKKYSKDLKIMKDPGKGKSFALNIAFSKLDTDILILSDGDVYLGKNAIEEIVNLFSNPKIGCISGRPVPQESRKTKFGYWANFLFDSAHKIRKNAFENSSFLECSGYLFAFRKNLIDKIPLDVSEDTVIPYMFRQKGFDIGYAEKAEVFVKNPDNLKDWIKQKTRTHKAHEKLYLYVDTKKIPRVKSFSTESKGIFWLLRYPRTLKEFIWTIQLAFARLYTWIKYFLETKIHKQKYQDGWERVESTK